MNFFNNIKAKKALVLQSKGKTNEAEFIYKSLVNKNYLSARYLLAYSVLLIKKSNFQKAKDIILLAEKAPDMSLEHKKQVYINYAICLFKLGEKNKAIKLLEKEHNSHTSGLLQETLGYMYIENNDFDVAYDFLMESLEYDDTDPIVLDNVGQFYYRKPNSDKIEAKKYFEKAIKIRPGQIDTLFFLAQYDIEEGNFNYAKEKLNRALKGNFSPLNYAQKDTIIKLLDSIKIKIY